MSAELRPQHAITSSRLRPPMVQPPMRPNADGPPLSLLSCVQTAYFYRKAIAAIVFGALCASLVIVLFAPRRYKATMQLVVVNTRESAIITSNAGTARQVNDVSDADVNSEAELLRGRGVLADTISRLGGQPASPDKAIELLDRELDISPVRQSNVINVSYIASSPSIARDTLKALAASFVQKELALRRPLHSQQFYSDLVTAGRNQLAEAEARLADYKIRVGIPSLAETEAGLIHEYQNSKSQTADLAATVAEEHQRAESAKLQLQLHPPRVSTQIKSTFDQRAVGDLVATLVQLQNKRTALLTGYQPSERIVQEVDQQIDTVQREIANQKTTSDSESTTDINPVNQDIRGLLAKADISAASTLARRQSIEAESRRSRQRLNDLEVNRATYTDLQERVNEAQRNVELADQKLDQAAFEDALDKERILNVAFAADPSASSIPVQPRPRLYLALGLFTGIFFAAGYCILREATRTTILSAAELELLTGVPTAATIPLMADRSSGSSIIHAPGTMALASRSTERPIPSGGEGIPLGHLIAEIDSIYACEEASLLLGVVGYKQGEGTSFIVHGLATQLALKAHTRVLRVNLAQLIRCRLLSAAELLAACSRCEDSSAWVLTPPGRLLLIDPEETASAAQVEQMLGDLASHFRIMVLDCGLLSTSSAFWSVARIVNAVFLVAAAGATTKANVLSAQSLIRRSGTSLSGCILTRYANPLPRWLAKGLA